MSCSNKIFCHHLHSSLEQEYIKLKINLDEMDSKPVFSPQKFEQKPGSAMY